MADDTNKPRPGDAPGLLRTGDDGSLPDLPGHQPAWVRMQDSDEGGGGRFDVLAKAVRVWERKGCRVVPNYPIHFGPSGRLATPRANLAPPPQTAPQSGPTATDGAPPVEGEPAGDPTLGQPASSLGAVEPARLTDVDTSGAADPDPTLAQPASSLGAVEPARKNDDDEAADVAEEPAGDDTGDDTAPADAGDDQAAGEPAAAKTTSKRGRR